MLEIYMKYFYLTRVHHQYILLLWHCLERHNIRRWQQHHRVSFDKGERICVSLFYFYYYINCRFYKSRGFQKKYPFVFEI